MSNSCTGDSTNASENLDRTKGASHWSTSKAKKHPLAKAPFRQARIKSPTRLMTRALTANWQCSRECTRKCARSLSTCPIFTCSVLAHESLEIPKEGKSAIDLNN